MKKQKKFLTKKAGESLFASNFIQSLIVSFEEPICQPCIVIKKLDHFSELLESINFLIRDAYAEIMNTNIFPVKETTKDVNDINNWIETLITIRDRIRYENGC